MPLTWYEISHASGFLSSKSILTEGGKSLQNAPEFSSDIVRRFGWNMKEVQQRETTMSGVFFDCKRKIKASSGQESRKQEILESHNKITLLNRCSAI